MKRNKFLTWSTKNNLNKCLNDYKITNILIALVSWILHNLKWEDVNLIPTILFTKKWKGCKLKSSYPYSLRNLNIELNSVKTMKMVKNVSLEESADLPMVTNSYFKSPNSITKSINLSHAKTLLIHNVLMEQDVYIVTKNELFSKFWLIRLIKECYFWEKIIITNKMKIFIVWIVLEI